MSNTKIQSEAKFTQLWKLRQLLFAPINCALPSKNKILVKDKTVLTNNEECTLAIHYSIVQYHFFNRPVGITTETGL